MINSITVLGSSSGRNAGDAALIAGLIGSIDEATGRSLRYEIPSIRPSYIRNHYPSNAVPVGMMPWNLSVKMFGLPTYQSIMKTDLSLIFDAPLFDRQLYNPLFNYMSTLALMLPRAKKKGKKLCCYNVGVGPVDTAPGRRMLRDISEVMDFITVRETSSLKLLRDIGVTNPRILVTADAALTMPPASDARVVEIMRKLGLIPGEDVLGININAYLDTWVRPKRPSMGKEKFLSVYAEAINRFTKEINVPVVFVSTQHHDVPVTRELMEKVNANRKILFSNVDYNHYDVKGVLGKLSLLFGMRLHATILSSSALTPTIGIEYQPKVAYYFNTLGMKDLCMSFNDFSPEAMYQHIRNAWEQRDAIRAKLTQVIPHRQKDASKAAEIIAAISRGEDIDTAFNTIAAEPDHGSIALGSR